VEAQTIFQDLAVTDRAGRTDAGYLQGAFPSSIFERIDRAAFHSGHQGLGPTAPLRIPPTASRAAGDNSNLKPNLTQS
jgi:hypothetical protein